MIVDFFKKILPKKKIIWNNKTAKEMLNEDWIEYSEYKRWIVQISNKVPNNGDSISLKFKDKIFKIRDLTFLISNK